MEDYQEIKSRVNEMYASYSLNNLFNHVHSKPKRSNVDEETKDVFRQLVIDSMDTDGAKMSEKLRKAIGEL